MDIWFIVVITDKCNVSHMRGACIRFVTSLVDLNETSVGDGTGTAF